MTEISDKRLLDTNILVYAFDITERDKHIIAKDLLFDLFSKEQISFISIQSLSEFFVISTKKLPKPVDKKEARELIEKIIDSKNFRILKFNTNTVLSAIDSHIKYGASYWDALIAAVMQENMVNTIITENEKDFKKIPWLTVINPFKK